MPSPISSLDPPDAVLKPQSGAVNSIFSSEKEAGVSGATQDGIRPDTHGISQHPNNQTPESASTERLFSPSASHSVNREVSTVTSGGPTSPEPALNGIPQSRKRSRSGTRIAKNPSSVKSGQYRMVKDAGASALARTKTMRYFARDVRHYTAMSQDSEERQKLSISKRNEKERYMKLRGIPTPDGLDHANRSQSESRSLRHWPSRVDLPPQPLLDPAAMYGRGYGQYGNFGNRTTEKRPIVMYPCHRERNGGRKAPELRISRKQLQRHAELIEDLVPVRLDIEWEKIRLRDTFTWNLHDRLISPDFFAIQLVEDFGLTVENCRPLIEQIATAIKEQIQDYYPHVIVEDVLEDRSVPYISHKDEEMRITIKLNITIGSLTLVDQFEWDLNNASDSPEIFAKRLALDNNLGTEFVTAIAHDIREQCQLFTRSLYILGHPFDGSLISDQDLQAALGPSPLHEWRRPLQAGKEYTPYLYELNDAELDKTELSLSREERRQKRSVNRRGGPVLPDLKDRRRTIRTLIVSSTIPGEAETIEESRLFKRVPAVGKRRTGYGQKDGLEDSDDSESELSAPDSPAIPQHLLTGTARTRGMRGAATVAQAAMLGSLGRSATPEASILHHHETRTSGRRFGTRGYREESVDDSSPTLMIKLRISPHRLRQFARDEKTRGNPGPLDSGHHTRRSSSGAPNHAPLGHGVMAPPSTPGHPHSQHFQHVSPGHMKDVNPLHPHAAQMGRVNANGPPDEANPIPPPPDWLNAALNELQSSYPSDRFEGTMRYTSVSIVTDLPISLKQNEPNSEEIKFMYYPRIKCLDCPGKLYTPGPEKGVNNFEVHLRNKIHREKVEARISGSDDGREAFRT